MPNNPDNHFNTSSTGETENNEEILRPRGNMTLKAQLEANEAERAQIVARAKARFKELQAELEERRLNLKGLEEDAMAKNESRPTPAETAPTQPETITQVAPFADVGPIAEPEPIVADTVADADIDEPNSQETEQNPALVKKIGRSKSFGKYVAGLVALFGVSAALGLGLAGGGSKNTVAQKTPTAIESNQNQQNQEKEKGIKDGYDQKGMWLSENKGTSVDFACAKEVAEKCENDECDMIRYTAFNQTESFADYLANLPKEIQPKGFKGLSILETEKKIESLSEDEYENLKKDFSKIMLDAFTRRTTLNGKYHNAYMTKKDANGKVDHDNMKLVACTTDEKNYETTQFFWEGQDGKEIGSMTVKMTPVYDKDDHIISYEGCIQVVSQNSKNYVGLEEIPNPEKPESPEKPNNPDTPTPTPTPTPPAIKAPKDAENLKRIDNQILKDIAEDIGTEKVVVHQDTAKTETERPTSQDYEPLNIVRNEQSTNATVVTPQASENNYSENHGGANEGNAEVRVEANEAGQQEADRNENKTPASLNDESVLRDLGL